MADPIVTLETFSYEKDRPYAFRFWVVWRDGYKLKQEAKKLVELSRSLALSQELDHLADDS